MIEFWKMHGLGNDFVVIDCTEEEFDFNPEVIRNLSHRNLGIGFDQLLLVKRSDVADFKYEIYNADGSAVEQCGNGARCLARFVHEKSLINKTDFTLEVKRSIIRVKILEDRRVAVGMGDPDFNVDFCTAELVGKPSSLRVSYGEGFLECYVVSIGNPHCVIFGLGDVSEIALLLGEYFPYGINVSLAEIMDDRNISVRTFERGVGLTLACGSGGCAVATVAVELGLAKSPVNIHFKLGSLEIEYGEFGLIMIGGCNLVFEGRFVLNNFRRVYE